MGRKTPDDPTGQKTNRIRTYKATSRRLKKAAAKILADIRKLSPTRTTQKIITNAPLVVYQYDLSSSDLESIQLSIQSHLDGELETFMDSMPVDWWYKKQIEQPYRQGTLEELNEIERLLSTTAIGSAIIGETVLSPTSVLFSPAYLDGVRAAQVRNYGLIKSLSQATAKQVYQVIDDGVQSGSSIRTIAGDIKGRFKVADSSAKRIATTEVNRAYNDARLRTVTQAETATGASMGVLHISSLLSTTRQTHSARHNNVYTPAQETRWWNEGANRINCQCTTRTVLFDSDGNVIQSELQKKFRDMRNALY